MLKHLQVINIDSPTAIDSVVSYLTENDTDWTPGLQLNLDRCIKGGLRERSRALFLTATQILRTSVPGWAIFRSNDEVDVCAITENGAGKLIIPLKLPAEGAFLKDGDIAANQQNAAEIQEIKLQIGEAVFCIMKPTYISKGVVFYYLTSGEEVTKQVGQ